MLFEEMLKDEYIAGQKDGRADSIITLLSRSNTVPEQLRQRIYAETDLDTLNKWLILSTTASIEEFENHMFD